MHLKCPYCGRPGLKRLKSYCCKAHYKLDKKAVRLNIPCRGCGVPQRRVPSAVSKSGVVYCTRCKRAKGENHYKYSTGTYVDKAGYVMTMHNGKYVKQHRLVWEEANQACLFEQGTIHHIRFDLPHNKQYNDPDNLLLLSPKSHARFHRNYELGRLDLAFGILRAAAKQQMHYPLELDQFIAEHSNSEFSLPVDA
jgi:hypothetical protein